MRGIETLPLTLIAVAILLLIVASIGFTQLTTFLDFNSKREFKESLADFVQGIKLLKTTGNFGSFSSKDLKIPTGYSLSIDINSDIIGSNLPGEIYNISLSQMPVDIKAFNFDGSVSRNGTISFSGPADYKVVYHYGDLPDSQIRSLMLTFE